MFRALTITLATILFGSATAGEPNSKEIPPSAQSLVVAGGCFWCVEKDFEHLDGVYEAVSGYAGGENKNATYRNHEGHREAVEVFYDPAVTSAPELMHFFLRAIDPTDGGGQFCDRGHAYTTAIYYRTLAEQTAALDAIENAETELARPVVTAVEELPFFVVAEDYHQNYYKSGETIPTRFGFVKKKDAYKRYRKACGRDARIEALWGKSAN